MIWPFKRKPDAEIPINDGWTVLHVEQNGKKLIGRIHLAYREMAPIAKYDRVARVILAADDPQNPFGPSEEDERLYAIEDEFRESFERDRAGLIALILTWPKQKEFIFYTRDPRVLEKRFLELERRFDGQDMGFFVEDDPKWDGYLNWVESTGLYPPRQR